MLDPEDFQRELGLGDLPSEFKPDRNVSPGRLVPVVINKETRNVELYKWGLVPVWAKDPVIGNKMINARAETIAEKPSFRNSFQRRRCLILADGFYEWKSEANKKQPYLFKLIDGKPFTFAGIWDHWQDKNGKELTTCAIITTTPNQTISEYHDRMPVILDADTRWQWLEPSAAIIDLQKMMNPIPDDLMAQPEKIAPKSLYIFPE
jgi:putative SOS response-associated peptidase YedK